MSQELKKNTCCSYCGTRFTEQILWPRKCFRCYNDSFSNPLPVVVVLISVREEFTIEGKDGLPCSGVRYGTLIQKRGIEPHKGDWALTGGYIDDGETWQEAAVREVKEELGLETKEEHYQLWDVASSTKKNNVLIFCVLKTPIQDFNSTHFVENHEVEEVGVMWEEMELAFPTHTEHANKFLKTLQGWA